MAQDYPDLRRLTMTNGLLSPGTPKRYSRIPLPAAGVLLWGGKLDSTDLVLFLVSAEDEGIFRFRLGRHLANRLQSSFPHFDGHVSVFPE